MPVGMWRAMNVGVVDSKLRPWTLSLVFVDRFRNTNTEGNHITVYLLIKNRITEITLHSSVIHADIIIPILQDLVYLFTGNVSQCKHIKFTIPLTQYGGIVINSHVIFENGNQYTLSQQILEIPPVFVHKIVTHIKQTIIEYTLGAVDWECKMPKTETDYYE